MNEKTWSLAVNQFMAPDLKFADLTRLTRESGAEGVGVLTGAIADLGCATVARELARWDLRATSSCVALGLVAESREDRHHLMSLARSALAQASELGAPLVVVAGGPTSSMPLTSAREQFQEHFAALAEEARTMGGRLLLEPLGAASVHLSCVLGLRQGADVVSRVEGAGLVFDLWHTWTDPDLEQTVESADVLVDVVHVSDWPQQPSGIFERALPGTGILPICEILAKLDGSRPRWLELEVPLAGATPAEQAEATRVGLAWMTRALSGDRGEDEQCA